jgi:hypothetical protein
MNDWLAELQEMFDYFKGSATFWVVGGAVVLLLLATFVRGGRRG